MNYATCCGSTTSNIAITPITASFTTQNELMTELADYVGGTAPLEALTWSEGLASASDEYTSAWQNDNSISTLTTTSGTTTSSRAGTYGTVDGLITESAYFFSTDSIDSMDMMRLLITNDGSSYMAQALFDVTADYLNVYKYIGMSYKVKTGCSPNGTQSGANACDVVFDVVVAAGYTNNSGTEECNTTLDFGGGNCDPDETAQSVYETINEMRLQTMKWGAYIKEGDADALISNCSTYQCTSDYNGDGSSTARTYVRYNINIGVAATATQDAMETLEVLNWEPGLYMAAADQTSYCASQTSCSSTGAGGSTSAERVA